MTICQKISFKTTEDCRRGNRARLLFPHTSTQSPVYKQTCFPTIKSHACISRETGFLGGVLIYVSMVFPIYCKGYNSGQLLPILSFFGLKTGMDFDHCNLKFSIGIRHHDYFPQSGISILAKRDAYADTVCFMWSVLNLYRCFTFLFAMLPCTNRGFGSCAQCQHKVSTRWKPGKCKNRGFNLGGSHQPLAKKAERSCPNPGGLPYKNNGGTRRIF